MKRWLHRHEGRRSEELVSLVVTVGGAALGHGLVGLAAVCALLLPSRLSTVLSRLAVARSPGS